MKLKVLFIGGTGIISSACSPLAVESGMELTLLNRGSGSRLIPDGVEQIHADINDAAAVKSALEGRSYDVVVDWIAFTEDQVERDIELFRGRTGQYVFISSASAYQKPPASLPITEGTSLANPFWQYSRNKIACEERLMRAWREERFPVTIVRPSHTYDRTYIPLDGGYTVIDRMLRSKKVVVAGDGASLWVMTHHRDFAKGFVGLLGNPRAIGEAFHITSDEALTWDQIYKLFAAAAGAEAQIVHVPSETIARYNRGWGEGLLGDKTYTTIFDNSKVRSLVPDYRATISLAQGAREILEWHNADPARRQVDEETNHMLDAMIEAQEAVRPS